jgi:NSS family neurotransmitter:Na+ symporter
LAGKRGEFVGWWGVVNGGFLTMYYITILSWVLGMLVGSVGDLWQDSVAVPAFGLALGDLANPVAYFFSMLSSWKPFIYVAIIWFLNVLIVRRGVETIEPVTRVFVPLMWLFMIALIVRGVTLPHGDQGVLLLFTPNFAVMQDPAVWQGAFSQIFFTLSLGMGTMTAYASYLPKKSDLAQNAIITSLLNCGFEYIAGLAIFSILFAFMIVPQASTLAMTFFIIPKGIGEFPAGVQLFGVVFFGLLLIAGLTSSVSLFETLISPLRDKFRWSRKKIITIASLIGFVGSASFALPQVINPGLENDGTLGLTLLDLVDHWVFSYGLLVIGLSECLLIGWIVGAKTIRTHLNNNSKTRIHPWFDYLIKYCIPGLILFVLGYSVWGEIEAGLYGMNYASNYSEPYRFMGKAPVVILTVWFLTCVSAAALLTRTGEYLDVD